MIEIRMVRTVPLYSFGRYCRILMSQDQRTWHGTMHPRYGWMVVGRMAYHITETDKPVDVVPATKAEADLFEAWAKAWWKYQGSTRAFVKKLTTARAAWKLREEVPEVHGLAFEPIAEGSLRLLADGNRVWVSQQGVDGVEVAEITPGPDQAVEFLAAQSAYLTARSALDSAQQALLKAGDEARERDRARIAAGRIQLLPPVIVPAT